MFFWWFRTISASSFPHLTRLQGLLFCFRLFQSFGFFFLLVFLGWLLLAGTTICLPWTLCCSFCSWCIFVFSMSLSESSLSRYVSFSTSHPFFFLIRVTCFCAISLAWETIPLGAIFFFKGLWPWTYKIFSQNFLNCLINITKYILWFFSLGCYNLWDIHSFPSSHHCTSLTFFWSDMSQKWKFPSHFFKGRI